MISKKELLELTGISYGQLYRWKRDGLIPEEWFVKRPSFTGQETFFPTEKILSRVRAIQQLKDQYPLRDLARLLAPSLSDLIYSVPMLGAVAEIDPELTEALGKVLGRRSFTFLELLMLLAMTTAKRSLLLRNEEVESLFGGLRDAMRRVSDAQTLLILLRCGGQYYGVLTDPNIEVRFDSRMLRLFQVNLDDLSAEIKVKYRDTLPFLGEIMAEPADKAAD